MAIAVAGSNWTRVSVEASEGVVVLRRIYAELRRAGYIDANNYDAVVCEGDVSVALKHRLNGDGAEGYDSVWSGPTVSS